MGYERTHPQCIGQGQGLLVVGFGLFELWRMALRRDLAKQAQGPRLVAAFVMLAADFNGMPSLVQSVLESPGLQIPFAQGDNAKHMVKDISHGVGLLHQPLQQWQSIGHTPGQDIRRA
jgi:hypothetical protein